ncbi:MAG: DUF1232 domain-containing protein [Bacteroidales bacterium]
MNIQKAGKELFRSKWVGKAKRILSDPQLMRELIDSATQLTSRKGLEQVRENLLLLVGYLRDVASGKYKNYHAADLLLIVSALVYVVSPLDLIPDFLLIMGWTDDISIIAFALRKAWKEIDQYKQWRQSGTASDADSE